ncbi:MAG: DnaA/Hda family protein [Pseudomonadota bacterium]
MAEQLSFDLPIKTAHGREDFYVSSANATAVAMIETWRDWPARKLVLIGPVGAGKTHLAHVWAALSGAQILGADTLVSADVPTLARMPVAVEDCHAIAGRADAEDALFHLHNLALAEGQSLLFTAQTAPNYWGLTLPDLTSRMQGTLTIALELPDDRLLAAVLAKLFDDRQLIASPELLDYLVRRIERSFEAAHAIVAALDAAALSQGRAVNRTLARELLDKRGA